MKKLLGVMILLPLAVVTATTQGPRFHTRPLPPPEEVLDRLKLTLAWQTRVACTDTKDGLFSLQLLPGPNGFQFVVQTRQGVVVVLDAETGDLLWQTQVGLPYWPAQPVAFNSRALYVTRRDRVYSLDRKTGKHLFEGEDAYAKQRLVGVMLAGVPSAAPVASELMLYLPFGTRVAALKLPMKEGKRSDEPLAENLAKVMAEAAKRPLIVGEPQWLFDSFTNGLTIDQPLLLEGPVLAAVSPTGTFMSMRSTERSEPLKFITDHPAAAAMGQFEKFAYLASEDTNVYAFDMERCAQVWRFTADAPIFRKPEVTARDVFVSPSRLGLYRVDRETGVARWLNRDASRFLATNSEFVYATDHLGRFLVLDYVRGTTMAVYDLRDFTVTYSNELTDRIYLGSNDGLIVCLRLRGQATPLLNKLPLPKLKPKTKPKEQKKPNDAGVGALAPAPAQTTFLCRVEQAEDLAARSPVALEALRLRP